MSSNESTQSTQSTHWDDIQRLEGWAGEIRLNLVRLLAILVLYGRHLIEVISSPADAPVRGAYHAQVTWLCLMWAGAAIILHMWLTRRHVPWWLKYASTIFDAVMITFLCALAGGPKTALVLLYFPVIASTPLRVSLRLVYVATISAILGYLVVLGHYAWYVIGFTKYYSTPDLRIPRSQEAIYVLALLVTGFMCGQVVRQMRRMVAGYAVRVASGG